LTTQLEKVEDQEGEQAPVNLNQRLEVVYYYAQTAFDFSSMAASEADKYNPAFDELIHTSTFIEDIFHPPELI
jgi:hypothetical protein